MSFEEREAWRRDALCGGMDNRMFFPRQSMSASASLRFVRALCAKCPVNAECRDYAIENNIASGVWGGMGYKQRLRYAFETGMKEPNRTPRFEDAPCLELGSACGTKAGYNRHGCRGVACATTESIYHQVREAELEEAA